MNTNYNASSNFDSSQSTHVFTSFPDSQEGQNLLDDDSQTNINNNQLEQEVNNFEQDILDDKKYSFYQIEYYQRFFNVSSNAVMSRVLGSMVPTFNQSYLLNRIRPNPDLYGPFWITITLIFTIAISGNIYSFLSNFGNQIDWHTDFHKVTSSAAAIFLYWWLMPTALYLIMRWRQIQGDFEFIELLCIYGYSLSIYIPVAVIWLIHVPFIQWFFVLVAVLLSGSVLIFTFWPTFSKDESKKITYSVMLAIIFFHAILGIGFMLYFFHDTDHSKDIITTTATTKLESSKTQALLNSKLNSTT